MPPEVKCYVEATESFSVSGSDTNGQGAGFLQEEANRQVKSLLPAGPVTSETLVKVSGATELIKNVKEGLVLSTLDQPCRLYKKFDNEVTMVRKMIRSSSIFCDPMSPDPPVSVSEEVLDPLLGTIKDHVVENYKTYKQHVASSNSFTRVNLPVFCVTIGERQKTSAIELKTKAVIAQEIGRLFDLFPDKSVLGDSQEQLQGFLRKSNTKQAVYLALYYDVLQNLQQQLAETVDAPAEGEE